MKAVTTALVLIAGAAVVLWYGNTLNSWVLGGLIGGLAALLLSIPISLILFSYLSHHHDERLRAEEQEEMSLAQEEYGYQQVPSRVARKSYEVESYVLSEQSPGESWQEEYVRRAPRVLPAPAAQRQAAANQGQISRDSNRLPVPRPTYLPVPRPQQAKPRGKDTTVLRATTRKMTYPGFPGYEPGSTLSQHRSQALRTARSEANARKRDEDVEVFPTNNPKRGLSVRPGQALTEQSRYETSQRPSRQLPQQSANQQRPRRVVDASPSQQGARRPLPAEGESTASSRRSDPQTDYLRSHLPQTAPLRRSAQTGRQLQGGEQYTASEATTDSLNKPLLRRAPYMYDDDPLRQELAQQIDDTPAIRRSSRYEAIPNDDDDELI